MVALHAAVLLEAPSTLVVEQATPTEEVMPQSETPFLR
jgi:hypothetical protein